MRTGILTLFFTCISIPLLAQETSSGFDILTISPTPYSLSKSEATTSVSDGAASIYSNPALLAYNSNSSIDLGYTFWIAEENNIFGGVNFLRDRSAVAFSFYTSGSSQYEQYSGPGQSNGTFSIRYLSISAAYAYDFKILSLGGAVQYLNEEIFSYKAKGYAFNFGIATRLINDRIRLGASFTNLGEMEELNIEATTLPAVFKTGLSADIIEFSAPSNNELPILISAYADFIHPMTERSNSKNYMNLGLSVSIADVLELSSGYKTQNEVRPISFGAGFRTNEITFNYALIPFNTGYGTVHSIGIQYKF